MNRKKLIISFICFVFAAVLFLTTDPNAVPAPLLIVPFLLFFVGIFSLTAYFLATKGFGDKKNDTD